MQLTLRGTVTRVDKTLCVVVIAIECCYVLCFVNYCNSSRLEADRLIENRYD